MDTSAVVKLLTEEPGSGAARDARENADALVVAAITEVETVAALRRSQRGGTLDRRSHGRARKAFAELWERVGKVAIDAPVLREAVEAADAHGLRGYDAVQLGCIRSIADLNPVVVCFDQELRAAAAADGRTLWPLDPA